MMELIDFPLNQPSLIIVPSNSKGTGFVRTVQDTQVTKLFIENQITDEEFLGVIDKASKLVSEAYTKKRRQDTKNTPGKYKIINIATWSLMLIGLIMAFYIPTVDHIAYDIACYLLFTIPMFVNFIVSLVNYCKGNKVIYTFNFMVQTKVKPYFEDINTKIYKDRGMEWFLVDAHLWIELRINNPNNVP